VIQCASGSHLNKWLGRLSTGLGNGQPDQGQFDVEEVDVDFVTGSCMFTSAAFVEEVGLLAEEYFLYYEEPDWAERGRRAGDWQLGYAWKARVYHKEGASTGGGTHRRKSVSLLSDFYFVRSRVLYTRKFNARYLLTVYLGLLLAMASRAWNGQWNRILMILKVMLKPIRTYKASPHTGKG
jgi:hypothetical protein